MDDRRERLFKHAAISSDRERALGNLLLDGVERFGAEKVREAVLEVVSRPPRWTRELAWLIGRGRS